MPYLICSVFYFVSVFFLIIQIRYLINKINEIKEKFFFFSIFVWHLMWMPAFISSMIVSVQFLIFFNIILLSNGLFKFTNLKCLEFDKPFATIPMCKLKLVRRGVVALNLKVSLHQVPVTNVTVSFKSKRSHQLIIFYMIS